MERRGGGATRGHSSPSKALLPKRERGPRDAGQFLADVWLRQRRKPLTNKDRGDPCGRFYPGFKEAPQASERVF
jgi:hypothetical protein